MKQSETAARESSAHAYDIILQTYLTYLSTPYFSKSPLLNRTHERMEQKVDESANVAPKLEALRDRVETVLRDPLEEEWDEVLGQWSGAARSDREAVRTYVGELRDRVLDSLLAIDSPEEFKRGLAIGYVELKCHWTMLNTRIQHQTAQSGRPDEPLIYRATCVSLIVQALEPMLSREYVEGIADFLAEPLS